MRIRSLLIRRSTEFRLVGNTSVHLTGYFMPLAEYDKGMCPYKCE